MQELHHEESHLVNPVIPSVPGCSRGGGFSALARKSATRRVDETTLKKRHATGGISVAAGMKAKVAISS
jgi:hypothetical protein